MLSSCIVYCCRCCPSEWHDCFTFTSLSLVLSWNQNQRLMWDGSHCHVRSCQVSEWVSCCAKCCDTLCVGRCSLLSMLFVLVEDLWHSLCLLLINWSHLISSVYVHWWRFVLSIVAQQLGWPWSAVIIVFTVKHLLSLSHIHSNVSPAKSQSSLVARGNSQHLYWVLCGCHVTSQLFHSSSAVEYPNPFFGWMLTRGHILETS